MSKKHRKKRYTEFLRNNQGVVAPSQASSQVSNLVTVPVSTETTKQASVYTAHSEEYRYIWTDLIRLLIINSLFLAAVLAIYFVNKSNPFLQTWYGKIF